MQLTIFSQDDKTYYMEIGKEMQLADLLALVAAEVSASRISCCSWHSTDMSPVGAGRLKLT
jgi:hypothetical protein